MNGSRRLASLLFLVVLLIGQFCQAARFYPLGDLPGGDDFSYATALAAGDEGVVVVGASRSEQGDEAIRWSLADGIINSLDDPGVLSAFNNASRDGQTHVGWTRDGDATQAILWSPSAGVTEIGDFDGGQIFSQATAVSDDGATVIGTGTRNGRNEAFVWNDGQLLGLGITPDYNASFGQAVTADGITVFGWSETRNQFGIFTIPWTWTEGDGRRELILPPGTNAAPSSVTPDGSLMVGTIFGQDFPLQPFRWTERDGVQRLPDWNPNRFGQGQGFSVTDDGKTVVGGANTDFVQGNWFPRRAFIFQEEEGTRDLWEVLNLDHGLSDELEGWTLSLASDISGDGRYITGTGINPQGQTEAWLVDLSGLQAGDANRDLSFDQLDLVKVQQAAKYLTGSGATWGEGDWDGAPGGSQESPPLGDGQFDQLDIIAALTGGAYLTGPYAASTRKQVTQSDVAVTYDANTGKLQINSSAELTSIRVTSQSGVLRGTIPDSLEGTFDVSSQHEIFKATFGGSFGSIDLGQIAKPNLTREFVQGDLTVTATIASGGVVESIPISFIPIPEPSSWCLILIGLLACIGTRNARWRPRFFA